jgi:hypothetical protein
MVEGEALDLQHIGTIEAAIAGLVTSAVCTAAGMGRYCSKAIMWSF